MDESRNTAEPALSSTYPRESFTDPTVLYLVLAAGLVLGAILGYPNLDYSPNDASRWNTIYFLAEHGTYEIRPVHGAQWPGLPDHRIDPNTVPPEKRGDLFEVDGKYYPSVAHMPLFYTIDIVSQGGKYYSSKPPLLPTLLAGVVLAIEKVSGTSFRTHPRFIMRSTLIIAQVIPLLLCIWMISRIVLRYSESAFLRHFCIATAALGTYLTPWSVTLNNHVIAACSTMVAIYALIQIWYEARREWYWFVLAGFFGSFTAANEFPAALFAAAVMLTMFIKDWKNTLIWALPFAILPVAGSCMTNYIAFGRVTPIYADFGKIGGAYDYKGSYWPPRGTPSGIDALQEPWLTYMGNILIGHHGLFLLTPILLISFIGIIRELRHAPEARPLLAVFVPVVTAAIACFYTFYTTESRNYGGTAQGPRWMFWLIPLWLLFLPSGVELLARKCFGRAVCYLLLAVSLVSVGFAIRQPWTESWAQLLFREWHWIKY